MGAKKAPLNGLRNGLPRRPSAALFRLGPVEEKRLIAAAKAGDDKALRSLIDLLSGPIYRYGRTFCRDEADAEDVSQVVLIALFRTLKGYRGQGSLSSWAYTVARNACARKRRAPAGRPRMESLDTGAGPAARQVSHPAQDPERDAERAELRDAIAVAIRELPAPQRDVLVLRDVEGQPAARVGKILGLSERAVKSRLHRARITLRERLARFLDAPSVQPRCPDTTRLISRFLEGDLDAAACARIKRHVEECGACVAACDALRDALIVCRDLGRARPPLEVARRVRAAMREAARP
jgi:RNA polymerase sigma-70 factor (ECF subfamily)